MKLLARYPNNTKLIDTEIKDSKGNSKQIVYENGALLTETKISGVVYINETTYQVYSGVDLKQTGLFIIGEGFDWEAKTPRQKYQEAYFQFDNLVRKRITELNNRCFCSYPRIIDYIENRHSHDSRVLQRNLKDHYLKYGKTSYDKSSEVETTEMNCKICGSLFEWRYKERGIDHINLKNNVEKNIIGKQPLEEVPNFLSAYFNEVFCRKSFIHRQRMIKADLESTIHYLFEEKETTNNYYDD